MRHLVRWVYESLHHALSYQIKFSKVKIFIKTQLFFVSTHCQLPNEVVEMKRTPTEAEIDALWWHLRRTFAVKSPGNANTAIGNPPPVTMSPVTTRSTIPVAFSPHGIGISPGWRGVMPLDVADETVGLHDIGRPTRPSDASNRLSGSSAVWPGRESELKAPPSASPSLQQMRPLLQPSNLTQHFFGPSQPSNVREPPVQPTGQTDNQSGRRVGLRRQHSSLVVRPPGLELGKGRSASGSFHYRRGEIVGCPRVCEPTSRSPIDQSPEQMIDASPPPRARYSLASHPATSPRPLDAFLDEQPGDMSAWRMQVGKYHLVFHIKVEFRDYE
ncbi:unnamed protein product [Protopolystoma xenopodis]|uniref:Uncharacterized protein n=1 Tax=Protopolystoma xenopodis TaxID=117903 RepID=A0A448XAX2_9PLAT|nr:unnamed protein product [Protopolystoma xenopodis]